MSRNLTTQDVSWFLDLKGRDQLNLDPPYQRRSVWSPRDKRFFIDTILNNYPAPPIFLHKTIDKHGHSTYHVVDGKQRLQTIIEFTENRVRIPDDFSDVNLQSKRWSDLETISKERLWNYVLVVEMLHDVNDAPIRNIFDRINRNSRKLTPQEMRHAKYDGWFINFAEAEAEKIEWKNFGVVTAARIKRMADVQFMSELLAIILKREMQGFDQNALDALFAACEDIDDNPMLIEDDFANEVETAKGKISEILKLEPKLIDYLKVQSHFYTLWAYIYLERKRYVGNEAFAPTYKGFLDAVAEILASPPEQAEEVIERGQAAERFGRQAILTYARNIRGANTDLTPRTRRYEGLCTAIHGQEDAANEDS